MRRTCWTCDHFGKCNPIVRSCKDWQPFGGTAVVFNIQGFAASWEKAHRRWWQRPFYKGLVAQRVHALDRYLAGRNEADVVTESYKAMVKASEEALHGQA